MKQGKKAGAKWGGMIAKIARFGNMKEMGKEWCPKGAVAIMYYIRERWS